MKNGNTFFMQVSRAIFDKEHAHLSNGAKMLFVVLNELEQRYCGRGKDWFYRTDEELAKDMNVSIHTLQKYKAELKNGAKDLVRINKMKWIDEISGKLSEKAVTSYHILR